MGLFQPGRKNGEKNLKRTTKGAVIAAAVGGLFLASHPLFAADAKAPAKDAGVKCSGANACKGKGACGSAENSCKGKNGCKGKGWMMMKSEKECTGKGGKVVADKK